MPVLQGALLCDAARDYNGLVSILGGFASIIQVERLPMPAPIWFAGRVAFTHEEARETHQIKIRAVSDSNDTTLSEVLATMPPQDPTKLPDPEQMGGLNLIVPLPFVITELGLYWVELIVDEVQLVRLPLKAIERPRPG